MFNLKNLIKKAKQANKTIVLPEAAYSERVMQAAIKLNKDRICKIIILGDEAELKTKYTDKHLNGITIMNHKNAAILPSLVDSLVEIRKNKDMTKEQAEKLLLDEIYFGTMLVKMGLADSLVAGAENPTANTIRPALQVIKAKTVGEIVSSCFLVVGKNKMLKNDGCLFLADCGLNQKPSPAELAQIAYQTCETAKTLTGITPKVAFLSYSTLGSAESAEINLTREAVKIFKEKHPEILAEGELQFDSAMVPEVASIKAKGSLVAGEANILIFPNLEAGNICYKAIQYFGGCMAIGPILQGLAKSVNDLSRGTTVEEIVLMCAVSCLQ